VNPAPDNAALAAVREWLRNERRLGVSHVSVPLPRRSTSSQPASPPPPTPAARAKIAPPPPAPHPPRRVATSGTAPAPAGARELPQLSTRDLTAADANAELAALDAGWVRTCTRCGLHGGRKQTVFGVGNPRPDVVFVGEGPGADEDEQGIPFVGRAGQLLTKMIGAMTLARDQVYICNVVKCRPPGNRTPTPEEMSACSPFLFRQLALLRPKVIVTLGAPAGQTLLATKTPIGKLRGRFHDFPPPALAESGLPTCQLMPTFHPAYLLRSPDEKWKTWDDLKQVMRFLGLQVPGAE
jgi:DNA polymerase